jgi:protein SCO1/2
MAAGTLPAAILLFGDVKFLDRLLWAGLVAIMMVVVVVFVRAPRRQPMPSFPVISSVSPFALTNQFGIRTEKSHLDDFVWVVDVIFTRCPGQCHQLSQMLRRIQDRLPVGSPVRLVSLTADPEYDTPAVMARYGTRYGFGTNNWLFLTGPKAEVYGLATGGLKFSVVENDGAKATNIEDQFIHSASFAIVDRRGQLRTMIQAESPDAVETVLRAVKALLGEKHQ